MSQNQDLEEKRKRRARRAARRRRERRRKLIMRAVFLVLLVVVLLGIAVVPALADKDEDEDDPMYLEDWDHKFDYWSQGGRYAWMLGGECSCRLSDFPMIRPEDTQEDGDGWRLSAYWD